MAEDVKTLAQAKARLAASRAALVAVMTPPRTTRAAAASPSALSSSSDAAHDEPAPSSVSQRVQQRLRQGVAGRWWRRSHMSTVTELATPFLQHYAARHPAKLMAYAAGTGSLLVILKPWRLLSLSMVIGLMVRSTDIAGMLSDFVVPELGDTSHPRDDFLDRSP
jgi:hypothetical protein